MYILLVLSVLSSWYLGGGRRYARGHVLERNQSGVVWIKRDTEPGQ
jgi:hypothetical protein